MDLIEQYNKILYQDKQLWFQKSRSNWITQGDRNTKFFHLSKTKMRKCKIETLKNESGIWIDNIDALKSMIFYYFVEHFNGTLTIQLDHWNNLTLGLIRQEANDELSREISSDEISISDVASPLQQSFDDPLPSQSPSQPHFLSFIPCSLHP
ncbi:hypothetical protein ACSBR1_037866 [Camellia fascicularis]